MSRIKRFDRRIAPGDSRVSVKSMEELAWLGKDNLQKFLRYWKETRAQLIRRRDKVSSGKRANPKSFSVVRNDLERVDGYISTLKQLIKAAPSKPVLPNLRTVDYFEDEQCFALCRDGRICYELGNVIDRDDDSILVEMINTGDCVKCQLDSLDFLSVCDLRYLVLNKDYARFMTEICDLDENARLERLSALHRAEIWFDVDA